MGRREDQHRLATNTAGFVERAVELGAREGTLSSIHIPRGRSDPLARDESAEQRMLPGELLERGPVLGDPARRERRRWLGDHPTPGDVDLGARGPLAWEQSVEPGT